jgi:hypothetical protein
MIDRARSLFHAIEVWGHDMDFEPLIVPEPTDARPGSEAKVRVLQARLEAGEDLYHEEDACIVATLEAQTAMACFVRGVACETRETNRASRNDNWFAAREARKRKANAS